MTSSSLPSCSWFILRSRKARWNSENGWPKPCGPGGTLRLPVLDLLRRGDEDDLFLFAGDLDGSGRSGNRRGFPCTDGERRRWANPERALPSASAKKRDAGRR